MYKCFSAVFTVCPLTLSCLVLPRSSLESSTGSLAFTPQCSPAMTYYAVCMSVCSGQVDSELLTEVTSLMKNDRLLRLSKVNDLFLYSGFTLHDSRLVYTDYNII